MVYTIDHNVWESECKRAVLIASSGDRIDVPHINAYNATIRSLEIFRPGVLIYVRLNKFDYWPKLEDNPQEVNL